MASGVPFDRATALSDDNDDDEEISSRFISSSRSLFRNSPQVSGSPVKYWKPRSQDTDVPLSEQARNDCCGLHKLLRDRRHQFTPCESHLLRQWTWKSESIVGSLRHTETLTSHAGCVNTVHWNPEGTLLVSSGDDCRLVITDYYDLSKQNVIPTGHTENVFCAKVVPAKGEWVVTCSGDHQIRLFDINTSQLVLTYEGHTDRVKKFVIPPSSSSSSLSVYSCSDDGTVKLIDLRAKVKAVTTSRSSSSEMSTPQISSRHTRSFRRLSPLFDDIPFLSRQQRRASLPFWTSIFVDSPRQQEGPDTVAIFKQANRHFASPDRPAKAISSIALSALRPEYMAIGGELPFIWLLDRRLLTRPSSGSRLAAQTEPVAEFRPQGRVKCRSITGVDISRDGSRVIGSWSGERIYQFNVNDGIDSQMFKQRGQSKQIRCLLSPKLDSSPFSIASSHSAHPLHPSLCPKPTRSTADLLQMGGTIGPSPSTASNDRDPTGSDHHQLNPKHIFGGYIDDNPPLSSAESSSLEHLRKRQRTDSGLHPFSSQSHCTRSRLGEKSSTALSQSHRSPRSHVIAMPLLATRRQQSESLIPRRITILSSRYRHSNFRRRRVLIISDLLRTRPSPSRDTSGAGQPLHLLETKHSVNEVSPEGYMGNSEARQEPQTSLRSDGFTLHQLPATTEADVNAIESQGMSEEHHPQNQRLTEDKGKFSECNSQMLEQGTRDHKGFNAAPTRIAGNRNVGSGQVGVEDDPRRSHCQTSQIDLSSIHSQDVENNITNGNLQEPMSEEDSILPVNSTRTPRNPAIRNSPTASLIRQSNSDSLPSVRIRRELARLRRAAISIRPLQWRIDDPPRDESGTLSCFDDEDPRQRDREENATEGDPFEALVLSTSSQQYRRREREGERRGEERRKRRRRIVQRHPISLLSDHDSEKLGRRSDGEASYEGDEILTPRGSPEQEDVSQSLPSPFTFVSPNTFVWEGGSQQQSFDSNENNPGGHETTPIRRRLRRLALREPELGESDNESSAEGGDNSLPISPSSISTSESSDSDSEGRVPGSRWRSRGPSGYGPPSCHHSQGRVDVNRSTSNCTESRLGFYLSSKCLEKTFEGHCNRRTIKEVQYLGPSSEWVASGSDDGRFFIWDQKTAKLVFVGHNADAEVVNCVIDHPRDLAIATSGIDSDVKIWRPGPLTAKLDHTSDKIRKIIRENERQRVSPGVHSFAFQHAMLFFQLLEAARRYQRRQREGESQDEGREPSEDVAH